MKKIEKLTKEQEALIPVVRDEWIKFCLSGDTSIDRKELHKGIEWLYKMANVKKPILIFLDGPFACQYGANLLKYWIKNKKVSDQVLGQVSGQVRDQVIDQVRGQVSDQVIDQVRDQVIGQVLDQVLGQVSGQVRDQVIDQVRGQVSDQVIDQVRDQVIGQVSEYFNFSWCDLSDSGWISYGDFFKRIGISVTDKLDQYKKYIRSGPFFSIFLNGFAIVCGRPKTIKRNSRFNLHCENGAAAEWPNGEKYWFLNGIRMKEADVMTPAEKLDPKEVMKRENVDERRELIRKIGIERMLSVLKSRTLDTKGDYSLLEIELSSTIKNARYLKMKNPSIGIWHLEGVARECQTVQEAINWRAGDINKNWEPAKLT